MIQVVKRQTLVVVGTGMAGAKVVEEVLTRTPDRFSIRMFGAEPHGTYNRILLSSVLGGFLLFALAGFGCAAALVYVSRAWQGGFVGQGGLAPDVVRESLVVAVEAEAPA